MRRLSGGVSHVASMLEEDLRLRETGLQKPHITGLADLSASVLACRNVNSSEWVAILPRRDCNAASKERYIHRFLSNKMINSTVVMNGFIPEIISMICDNGKTAVLMLDQSKISDGFECLMVSLRIGNRALPVAWKVVETNGAIGFDVQEPLLDSVAKMIADDFNIMLAGDRFYGTSALINWCEEQGWQYRIRLKGNLIFQHDGGEITGNDAAKMKIESLENAKFNNTDITTNIGILHERAHKEPWIIAMNCQPNEYKTLDYGMRWGIECMFSDFKTRGFGITKTQLKHPDRIERLILILTVALYWAVSTGLKPENKQPKSQKKDAVRLRHSSKKEYASY